MTKEYVPQVGDIILVWGKGIIAKSLRFIISKVWGISSPANHAEIVVGSAEDISAEPEGVVLKAREKTLNEAKQIVIIRHKKMTRLKQDLLFRRISDYLGRGYDYYNHVRWYLLFLSITAPIIYFISDNLRKWLRRESKTRWHCSELTAQLYRDVGIECGYEDNSFVPPHYFLCLAKASSDWKIVWEKEEK